jgi:hypothetical protein
MALVQAEAAKEAALHAAHQAKPTFALGFMSRAYNLTNFGLASDHHLASHVAVPPREIANETFCLPSRSAPAARRAVLEYFSGLASISSRHMRCIMSYMPYP